MRTRNVAVAAVSGLGVAIIGACGTLLVTHDPSAPPAVVCDGSPDWCVVAKSDLDAMHPGYVFIDDHMAGLVLTGQTARFPITGGRVHEVKFCAVYDDADAKEWRCSPPVGSLSSGNTPFVLESLEALPLYGGGNPTNPARAASPSAGK
jgi:hypothetical protein